MPDLPAQNAPVIFKVFSKPWSVPSSARCAAFLINNNWDDFGYQTLHSLIVFDLHGVKHDIGYVKMGRFPESQIEHIIKLPKIFEKLDVKIFSVGQDDTYYEGLNRLGAEMRENILNALNDLAANTSLWNQARDLEVTRVSLLRGVSEKSVQGQFRRMAQGGVRLSKYHFTFIPPNRLLQNRVIFARIVFGHG